MENSNFNYEAGTIETLNKMVELNDGITILPELATKYFTNRQMQLIRHFKNPAPMREVGAVVPRDFVKHRLIQALKDEIMSAIPEKIKKNKNQNVIPL